MRGIVFHPEIRRLALGVLWSRLFGSVPLFTGGPVSLETLPEAPLPGPAWVRVRCRLAGLCGTDLRLLRLRFSTRSASMARKREIRRPICLGHEAVGEVLEMGPSVTGLKVGDRVVMVPGSCCAGLERTPACAMCARGLPLLCLHRDQSQPEPTLGGGWSERWVRHASELLAMPEDVPDEHAVLLEPLACSAHAVLRRPPADGDTVVVLGCGTIGLGTILAIRAMGRRVRIIAVARHDHQSAAARHFGADTVLCDPPDVLYEPLAEALGTTVLSGQAGNRLLHEGAAIVYDAVGSGQTLRHALRWACPRGAVVAIGISPRPAPSDCTPIWLREVDLMGSHGHGLETVDGRPWHTFALVLEWMRRKSLVPEGLVTHRYPLEDYRKAIGAASGKAGSKSIKVIFEMPCREPPRH